MCHSLSKASGGKDLEIEQPVSCWDCSSFDFHATLPGMYGPTLIRDKVIQVGQSRQKRLLASFGMMEALHHEQLPLDDVMGLIQQCKLPTYQEWKSMPVLTLPKPEPLSAQVGMRTRLGAP